MSFYCQKTNVMESRITVGDIKRRFEVLHELNSPVSARPTQSQESGSNLVPISHKPIDHLNASVNIKRTPAFRCDKGIKKVHNVAKAVNNYKEFNTSLDQTLKKPITNSSNITESCKKGNSQCKYTGTISRHNNVSKQIDKHLKPIASYTTPVKKPIRPNTLAVPKCSPRKTPHISSVASPPFHAELKQVLSSPLPSGPPPKKPPRTFAHKYSPDCEFNSREPCQNTGNVYTHAQSSQCSTMRPTRSKTESQIMLKKLENVLKQHQSISSQPVMKETQSFSKKSVSRNPQDPTKRYGLCLSPQESEQIMIASQRTEPIYADVRQTSNRTRSVTNRNQGLHYMSSPIRDVKPFIVPKTKMSDSDAVPLATSLAEGDSNIFETDAATPSNQKIQSWVNEAYDKVLSNPTDTSSDTDSVNSAPDDTVPPLKPCNDQEQLTVERKNYLKRVSSHGQYQNTLGATGHLFECLLLVGIDMDNVTKDKVAYLIKKYPPKAEVPVFIESCVFPDASEWPPPPSSNDVESQSSCYTVIITSEQGGRKYGYCKRVLPEGATVCLPLAYCLISSIKANGFYYRLLEEIERHHGQTEIAQMTFIRELYNHPFPMPGQTVKVSVDKLGHTEYIDVIRRPLNSKKEGSDLINVLNTIGRNLFIQALGSLLLERKVILLSHSISTLSSCIEGMQCALSPFLWQYTLISLVPLSMTELIESPTPYLVGLLKPYENSSRELPSFEGIKEMFALDLDDQKVLHRVGDENSVIPSSLNKALRVALNVCKNSPSLVEKNMIVSEAMLRLYVELIGRYNDFIFFNHKTQQKEFLRESFVKSAPSKNQQLFLDWFSETAMFNFYIQNKLVRGCDSRGRFEQLCLEFCDETRRVREKKDRGFITMKNIGEKFKEWI